MKLKVSSRPDSFRRAGFAFMKGPQEIEVDQKVAEVLKAEPMLIVEEIKEEVEVKEEVEEKIEVRAGVETKVGKKGKGK